MVLMNLFSNLFYNELIAILLSVDRHLVDLVQDVHIPNPN